MVRVTLTPEAGARFAEATARLVLRRVAIVVDGRVTAAPVLRSKIGGGSLSISALDLEAAKALVARLTPR